MTEIKALIFDLGNVIIPLEDEVSWWNESFLEIFQEPESVRDLRNEGFFVDYEKGSFDTEHFFTALEQYLKPGFDKSDVAGRWNALLKEIPQHRVDFLRKLKEKYELYLLSNTNEIHLNFIIQEMIKKFGEDVLDEIFDHCYYSYQIGEVKPDSEIYRKVLHEQRLIANQCLFIDDKTANLEGAVSLGIRIRHILPEQDITNVLRDL